jgi:hypothetical protein
MLVRSRFSAALLAPVINVAREVTARPLFIGLADKKPSDGDIRSLSKPVPFFPISNSTWPAAETYDRRRRFLAASAVAQVRLIPNDKRPIATRLLNPVVSQISLRTWNNEELWSGQPVAR